MICSVFVGTNFYCMKRILFFLFIASTLCACQQEDPSSIAPTELSITAEKGNTIVTLTSSTPTSSFAEGDKIGLFLPQNSTDVAWQYTGGLWKSSTPCYWKNKKDRFSYTAYAPYCTGSTKEAILMPDLSKQTGKLSDLSTYDFLIATADVSFSECKGKVTFSGASAFQHIYSLIAIQLKNEDTQDIITLQNLRLSGEHFFSSSTYNCNITPHHFNSITTPVHQLAIQDNSKLPEEGKTYYLLVRPTETAKEGNFQLSFTRGAQTFSAGATTSATTYKAGNLYSYTFVLKKGELLLEGTEIKPWIVIDQGESYLEESL